MRYQVIASWPLSRLLPRKGYRARLQSLDRAEGLARFLEGQGFVVRIELRERPANRLSGPGKVQTDTYGPPRELDSSAAAGRQGLNGGLSPSSSSAAPAVPPLPASPLAGQPATEPGAARSASVVSRPVVPLAWSGVRIGGMWR